MTQQVKALSTKSDSLSLVSGTHSVKGEIQSTQVFFCPHMHVGMPQLINKLIQMCN